MSSMEMEAGSMTTADLRDSLNKKVASYKRDLEGRKVQLKQLEDEETRFSLMGPEVELSDGFDHTSTGFHHCHFFSQKKKIDFFVFFKNLSF